MGTEKQENQDAAFCVREPGRLTSYFRAEWGPLAVVAASGLVYNVGLVAGPYFEGQLAQKLYDIMAGRARFGGMAALAAVYLLVILVVQAARCLKRFYVRRFANNTSRNMRHVLYHHLVHQSRSALQQESVGTLMTKALADVDACVEGMRKFTTEVFDTGIALAAYLVMMLVYDWRLALAASVFTPAAYLIAEKLKVVVYRYTTRYKKSAGRLNDATLERVQGAVTYRVFGREQNRNDAYEAALTEYEHAAVMANIWENTLQPIYNIIALAGVLFLLYFGAKNVLGTGTAHWDIAAFTAFLSCFAKMALKASKAAKLFNAVQKAQVSWGRIQPLMQPPKAEEPAVSPEDAGPVRLCVRDLAVGYAPGQNVVAGLSFDAAPGEIIGITGPVACGKSTLGKAFLCEGAYTGSITLNGRELRELTDAERSGLVGYLGHEPELVRDTLAENIRYGDEKDVAPYLRAVCLDREVATMPAGLETEIGSSGARLSGGQQDRLALARTLYHARPLLVLDDPFSAVDTATEGQILANLRALLPQAVVLIFSHRVTRFPEFDRVIWMQNGRCTVGSHAQLCAAEPAYAGIYAAQQAGGDLDEAPRA